MSFTNIVNYHCLFMMHLQEVKYVLIILLNQKSCGYSNELGFKKFGQREKSIDFIMFILFNKYLFIIYKL